MKKRMCFMLSLILILAGAVPAFAAETQSKELEQAILVVKKAVTIPADYTEFYYSSYQEEREDGTTTTAWSMEWGKEDGSAGMNARVDALGNLLSYSNYTDKDESGLSKVTREAGRKTADAFLAKAMPSLADKMKPVNEKENASSTWNLEYSYELEVNGLPAPFIRAEITVNKYTGELQQFTGLNAGQKIPEFPEAKPAYTAEQAAALYVEKLAPELKYFTSYDYKTKKLSVFAGYQMSAGSGKAIDAQTGEVVELSREYNAAQNEKARDAGGGTGAASSDLSPEEQAAIDQVSGLISKEKAESALKGAFDLSGLKITGSNLRRDYVEQDRYIWSISFDGAHGQVDAKTGEIVSFDYYDAYDSTGNAGVTPEQAVKKAEAFLKDIAPAKFAKTRLENRDEAIALYESRKEKTSSYRLSYIRLENGFGVNGNGLSVTVNAKTGKITSYSNNWYQSVTFPSLETAMDSKAAFEKFDAKGSLRLNYAQTADDKVILVYDFENAVTNYLVDPFSGKALGWDGKDFNDGLRPEYSDISGHWAEKTVTALLNNGYYLPGDAFQPDKAITQEEFLRYMYGRGESTETDDFYKMLERNKVVAAAEKAPTKVMTRQEAAKFMVRYLGFDSLASKTGIFKELFKDKVEDSYKGYAAICSGLDIMKGDAGGRFNGTASMTRAEAASALYQLFEVK